MKTPTKREGYDARHQDPGEEHVGRADPAACAIAETWFDKDGNMIPGGEAS